MDAIPISLVLLSTFMHASWNLLLKYKGGTQACFWRMQSSIVLIGAVPVLISLINHFSLSFTAILSLIGSGISCGLYYFSLARGYESGDFTTVYPASRALPVLLVGLGDTFRGRPPSVFGWFGMLFVAIGCFLVPLNSLKNLSYRAYLKPASLWILLTALGTVGYSLFDKIGTEAIPKGPLEVAVYCYFFQLMAFISSGLIRTFITKSKNQDHNAGWLIPITAGILCYTAYWLVLMAYQMVERASYVVAFRQFSIVIGVVLAFLLFNESGKKIRIAGAIFMTAGLLFLKMFGSPQ